MARFMPPSRVVPDVLRMRASEDGNHEFLKCGREWLTYASIDHESERLAVGLQRIGVRKGDRVAFVVPTRDELLQLFYAVAKLGAIVVPLNIYLKGEFLRYQLADCGASVLVVDNDGYSAAAPLLSQTEVRHLIVLDHINTASCSAAAIAFDDLLDQGDVLTHVRIDETDVLAIGYTSGTTGLPKGCMLSHGYYTVMPSAYVDAGWYGETDRLFTPLPFYNGGGHALVNMIALVAKIPTVLEPEFHASTFVDRAREERATVLFATGMSGMAVLAQPIRPDDADNPFRIAAFVPMPPSKQEEFAQRFDVTVLEGSYGQQECVPTSVARVDDPRRRAGAGRPVWYYDVAVHDDDDQPVAVGNVGEIVVRPVVPNSIFLGYWQKPEATMDSFRNLWHHTGDLGRLDEDGMLSFVDRKKDSLRRRGMNISSVEVEMCLLLHPAIAAAAVYAVPSEMTEDDVMAALVLVENTDLTPVGFFEFCKNSLPFYAVPRYVSLPASLPTNALGRVMKHVLRADGVKAANWDLAELGFTIGKSDRR